MKQHLEEKILNPIRRKLTLRPKRPIVFFITQYWNEKCRKWHLRDPRFKIFCKSTLLDSLLWTVLSSRAFTLKISRYTWRMSTSRRNRNKFIIIPTSATLKNTHVLTIHRRSDGGAVIRNFIHRLIRALHEATKFVGCEIHYYDPYKATITLTTTPFLKKDGFKSD